MDFNFLLILLVCVVVASVVGENEEKDAADSTSADDDSDMYMEPLEDHQESPSNLQPDNRQWYPSFSAYDSYDQPPLGHSRPFFYNTYQQQEGAYSQRNDPPTQQAVAFGPETKYAGYKGFTKGFKQGDAQQRASDPVSILGDGNFGVIQGGTFYPEKDAHESEGSSFDDYNSYYHNGHGRPSYFYPSNPKPKSGSQQQFENFRDFADINTTPDRQYSQYVVVYTNKNGTRTTEDVLAKSPTTSNVKPKNILESLALLDTENLNSNKKNPNDQEDSLSFQEEAVLQKKLSKSKRKLMKLLPEKKFEARLLKKEKELSEPLLALS